VTGRPAAGRTPIESDDITEIITKPLLLLEDNWYKMQEYNQNDLLSLAQNAMGFPFRKLVFEYVPKSEDAGGAEFSPDQTGKTEYHRVAGQYRQPAGFSAVHVLAEVIIPAAIRLLTSSKG
jgi:hypothetical protein